MAAFLQDKLFAGRYTLAELVGGDSFSQIWKAEDSMANKALVLIKIYTPEQGDEIDQIDAAFIPLHSLKHKHLVNAIDADIYEGYPYLVMPYPPKGSLLKQLKSGHAFTEEEIAGITKDIAGVLAFLHEQPSPVVYRELRPENIFISEDNRYMLADPRLNSGTGATASVAYAAPEMFAFRPVKDAASDVFSLGVLLYHLCTGSLPWEGKGGVVLLEGGEIPHLPTRHSRGLNTLIRTCLNPHKTRRPTAKQLRKEAEYYLRHHAWEGEGPALSKGVPGKKTVASPGARPSVARPKMGQKSIAMLLSVVVLLVIGVVLYFTVLDMPAENIRGGAGADQELANATAPKAIEAAGKAPATVPANEEKSAGEPEAKADVPEIKQSQATAPVSTKEKPGQPEAQQPLARAESRETLPVKADKAQPSAAKPVAENTPAPELKPANKPASTPVEGKAPLVKPAFMRPSSLAEYLNRLSDTRIPRSEREKWRSDITKYFSDKDHLIIDGKAGLISGTYTIDELISFLMRTRDTKVMINQQRTDARGKVSELHVEIIPKNPAQ